MAEPYLQPIDSITPEVQYEYFLSMHQDFSDTYEQLEKSVSVFLTIPQKFIQNVDPLLESYIRRMKTKLEYEPKGSIPESIRHFFRQFHIFIDITTDLLEDHHLFSAESATYLKKVHELNEKHHFENFSDCAKEYIRLTPELMVMQNWLKNIREKNDDALNRLRNLEDAWQGIKGEIING